MSDNVKVFVARGGHDGLGFFHTPIGVKNFDHFSVVKSRISKGLWFPKLATPMAPDNSLHQLVSPWQRLTFISRLEHQSMTSVMRHSSYYKFLYAVRGMLPSFMNLAATNTSMAIADQITSQAKDVLG